MHPGSYICAVIHIMSRKFSAVTIFTFQRFISILTDKIVVNSRSQVILTKLCYGPWHRVEQTTAEGLPTLTLSWSLSVYPKTIWDSTVKFSVWLYTPSRFGILSDVFSLTVYPLTIWHSIVIFPFGCIHTDYLTLYSDVFCLLFLCTHWLCDTL